MADLIVNGVPVVEVRLVTADVGPSLMQSAASNGLHASLVGIPPAISAFDRGNPTTILHPVDTGGSGLVVARSSPATGWNAFVAWARDRSRAGQSLKIAALGKGSIHAGPAQGRSQRAPGERERGALLNRGAQAPFVSSQPHPSGESRAYRASSSHRSCFSHPGIRSCAERFFPSNGHKGADWWGRVLLQRNMHEPKISCYRARDCPKPPYR